MKRVGVITMYHNSENYGGILQSYALVKKINDIGGDAMQIDFDRQNETLTAQKKKNLKICFAKAIKKIQNIRLKNKKNAIIKFRNNIPHTKTVNNNTIENITDLFDVFVCGSDQVWNPSAWCSEYLLGFVPTGKKKISYAASISKDKLTEPEKDIFKKYLSDFDAISVREESDVNLLKECVKSDIKHVLDPVLLLEKSEWESVCDKPIVHEKYIFCYFLGKRKNIYPLLDEFSENKGLPTYKIFGMDFFERNYGQKKVDAVGPAQFLSLIKNAEYVLTDSFHAMVFSFIFKKKCIVFSRNNERSMESRIKNFLKIIDREDIFINSSSRENIDEINRVSNIDCCKDFVEFEDQKRESIEFLKTQLI